MICQAEERRERARRVRWRETYSDDVEKEVAGAAAGAAAAAGASEAQEPGTFSRHVIDGQISASPCFGLISILEKTLRVITRRRRCYVISL